MRTLKNLLLILMLAIGSSPAHAAEPRELDWLELMPKNELEALREAGEPTLDHSGNARPLQSGSATTVPELAGLRVSLPGYIVPVELGEDETMSELFLVPYFGACIHMPPPPPNQIIHVRLPKPVPVTDMWAAYRLTGTLRISNTRNEMAESSYSLEDVVIEPYD